MLILGIETSGREGSIALIENGIVVDSRSLSQTGRRHAQSLVAEIDSVFKQQNVAYNDCTGIAVSIGPGSFTGLRVGIVCAKTFSYATGCALAAVDTFQAIANNSPSEIHEVHIIANAQRGELFAGKYMRGDDGYFVKENEIEICSIEEMVSSLTPDSVISGTGVSLIQEEVNNRCQALPEECRHPTASQIGLLGERMIQQNETVDAWSLVPHYIRLSAAEEKRIKEESEHPPATNL